MVSLVIDTWYPWEDHFLKCLLYKRSSIHALSTSWLNLWYNHFVMLNILRIFCKSKLLNIRYTLCGKIKNGVHAIKCISESVSLKKIVQWTILWNCRGDGAYKAMMTCPNHIWDMKFFSTFHKKNNILKSSQFLLGNW